MHRITGTSELSQSKGRGGSEGRKKRRVVAKHRNSPLNERIFRRVCVDENECWLWLGYTDRDGYATISISNWPHKAHRIVYQMFNGLLSEGLTIDHLCRVRRCLNPKHMEPVTNVENVMRGESIPAQFARNTHCKYGHPFDKENTYYRLTGGRRCRECARRSWREWNKKRLAHV
ncbi:MAG: HNH endonuclease signature motif containing protein [Planctomycetota bacterium]